MVTHRSAKTLAVPHCHWILKLLCLILSRLGAVAHACNLSYLGD
jgi:hypothetical protein